MLLIYDAVRDIKPERNRTNKMFESMLIKNVCAKNCRIYTFDEPKASSVYCV